MKIFSMIAIPIGHIKTYESCDAALLNLNEKTVHKIKNIDKKRRELF